VGWGVQTLRVRLGPGGWVGGGGLGGIGRLGWGGCW
jgi:hypothetical protein